MINGVINKEHLSQLKEQFDFLDHIGYGDLNYEALYKWACVMHNAKETGLLDRKGELNFVEIGGGLSPVQFYFSNFAKITNIEIWVRGKHKTWFPTDKDLLYSKCNRKNFKFKIDNITFLKEHFFNFAKNQKNNSVDLVYDCCSAIHINRNKQSIKSVFPIFLNHVYRILKPGGFFIATMDIMHPHKNEFKEFVHNKTLVDMIQRSGLNFVSDYNSEIDNFFLNFDNLHKPKPNSSICYKGSKLSCSPGCKKLPKEHLLFDGHGNKFFLRTSFVLAKG